jgi:hypothetical protein
MSFLVERQTGADLTNGGPLEPLKTGRGLLFLEDARRERREEE